MTTTFNIKQKKWISNTILIIFMALVGFSGFLSEVIKAPIKNSSEIIEQSLVFNNKELDLVNKLSLKNKAGEFIFERSNQDEKSTWYMTSPKTVATGSALIEKLFNSLTIIKTKKLLPDTKNNSVNFSLDKPSVSLTLTDKNQKNTLLEIGLVNSIDQSTYVRISGRKGIYHIETPSESLENLTLDNFIESTIFQLPISEINEFKITKKGISKELISLSRRENKWIFPDGKIANEKKTEDLINEFFKLKSSFILDQQSEQQKKQSSSLMAAPEYKVFLELKDNRKYIYSISTPIKNLIDKALNDEPHFLISEPQTQLIYIVKKEYLNIFDIKLDQVKNLIKETNIP